MNNEVDIRIKIIDGATTGVEKIDENLRRVEVDAQGAASKVNDLGSRLFSFNQLSAVFGSVRALIGEVNEAVGELTGEWKKQLTAETQLEQVMQTRMGSSAEDIKQIKEYAATLQEQGVVADEVSLTGIQQIGTFVKHKETLQTLMPVLDDLLVHQKGLNATQEDAMSIGNLIGKAMQGETTMLRRVGITFTEAEAKAIKFGDEQTRAATLAQVITENVGHMNDALAKTDAGKAKQTSMWLGDLKEELGKVVQAWQPLLTIMSSGGLAIVGIADLVNITRSLYAATNLHLGALIKDTVASWSHQVATMAEAGAQIRNTVSIAASSRIMAIHRTLLSALTAATGSATVATIALSAAYTAGLSLAIMGIISLFEKLTSREDEQTEKEKELAKAQDEAKETSEKIKEAKDAEREAYTNARAEMDATIAKLESFKGNKVAEKKLIDDINKKYAETFGVYGSVSAWYKVLSQNSDAYCRQLENEVVMRNLANEAASTQMKLDDVSGKKYSTKRPDILNINNGTTIQGKSDWDKANEQVAQLRGHLEDVRSKMRDTAKEGEKFANILLKGVPGVKQGTFEEYNKIPTAKKNDKPVSNPITYKELGDAIDYYQKKLENTKPTETAVIAKLGEKIQRYKEAQQAAKAAIDTAEGEDGTENTLNGINLLIKKQEELRNNATKENIGNYDKEIKRLNDVKTALEESSSPLQTSKEVNTYEELDNALARWEDKMKTASGNERVEIQRNITALNELRQAWDDALIIPPNSNSQLRTMKEMGDAISYYQQKEEQASGDELERLKNINRELEKKQQLTSEVSEIGTGTAELGDLKGLTNNELTIKLKEIGVDGIKKKIEDIKKLMSSGLTTDSQQKELKNNLQAWTQYEAKLKKSQISLKDAWGNIKSLGNGLQSMTQALKGNGTAWDKTTAFVDAATAVFESVMGIIQIVKALMATTATEQVAVSVVQQSANRAEAGTWQGLAAAKTAAAYAGIPFVGPGLAAGSMASMLAMIKASSIPAFSDGGLLYGPTLALAGEYAGASSNPEVIAPLSKLKGLLKNNGIAGKVEFEIRGRTLYGLLKKENNLIDRT